MTRAKPESRHPIDTTRGADRRSPPVYVREVDAWVDGLRAAGISRSRRRLDIMSMLTTGWLPWGVYWADGEHPCLSLCGRRYIMCCGHVLKPREAQMFVDAGLLTEGPPDKFGRPSLIITEAGKCWLSSNWSAPPKSRLT